VSSEHKHPLVRLGELTFQADDETLVREVRALVDPAATLRLNGKESDVEGYLRHVQQLRAAMEHGTISVIDEVRDGRGPCELLAARVVVRMTGKDGVVTKGESHLVGRIGDDGRLVSMVEIGRIVADEDDPVEV
jgi:hypothetical protein